MNHQQPSSAPREDGHVHFPESAWSFPVVLGLVDAGPWDATFAVLLLLLNLGDVAEGEQQHRP